MWNHFLAAINGLVTRLLKKSFTMKCLTYEEHKGLPYNMKIIVVYSSA